MRTRLIYIRITKIIGVIAAILVPTAIFAPLCVDNCLPYQLLIETLAITSAISFVFLGFVLPHFLNMNMDTDVGGD